MTLREDGNDDEPGFGPERRKSRDGKAYYITFDLHNGMGGRGSGLVE
jgi:hypothetical protein